MGEEEEGARGAKKKGVEGSGDRVGWVRGTRGCTMIVQQLKKLLKGTFQPR